MSSRLGETFNASLRLWVACLIEGLLFLPLWVFLQVYLQSEQASLPWYSILPVLSLAGVLLRHVIRRRWMQILASLPLGAAAGYLIGGMEPDVIPFMAAGALFAYLGMDAVNREHGLKTYAIGLMVYFAAVIIFARIPELQHTLTLLTCCGSLCLVLALLFTNTSFIRYNTFAAGTRRLPAGMRRYNWMYMLLFLIAVVLLASGAAKAIAILALGAVYTIIGFLSSLLSRSEETPIRGQGTPTTQEFLQTEIKEPGLLAVILDVLFYGLAAVAVAAGLYFGLRWLYRNSSGIFRRAVDALLSILRRENKQEQTAYQDEEVSIFAWEKTVQNFREYWRKRLKSGSRSDRWEAAEGSRERVRWLYRHWLTAKASEGYEVKAHLTPMETGEDIAEWSGGRKQSRKGERSGSEASPAELLRLYNEARYSQTAGSDKEPGQLEQLKKQLKL
ncbi:hypothetical protein R70723_15105 [Paenibacillus sp. FSL R7-0273]|uniref:hypothetical protein n=1 Tax=Paenibacillus sp. FSL R7-0273 TaxID=1536772 RepID=UPI0004F69B20|nr:hypothetical protein [Paenibacillus sp. FSL R7-0273]AIQ47063.1 hypothetical protein R70723_15105 [Paenibacillus sp. FSL R7-0273]OMF97182.1 hypothetical protein BK144_00525 [Paenibacillus sp. FSL R7-0273]